MHRVIRTQFSLGGRISSYVPGVVLTLIVAGAVYSLHAAISLPMVSPVILAILLGMLAGNLGALPVQAELGIAFCAKTLLRLTVMLLGAQITFVDLMALGPMGLVAVVCAIVAVMTAGAWLGKCMAIPRELTALISAGTAICGASAIAAANSVTRARNEAVSYAIGIITLYGTACMLIYPVLGPPIGLSDTQYGFWAGLSLHEVAQAVGAGFAQGDTAGKAAVTAKLARILLLSVVIAGLARSFLAQTPPQGETLSSPARPPIMPWFLLGFLLLATANSLGLIPAAITAALETSRPALTVIAMVAIGLSTQLDKLVALGTRPLILGLILTLLISLISLGFTSAFL